MTNRWPKNHLKDMTDTEIRQAGFAMGQCPRCKLPLDMGKSGWGNHCKGSPCQRAAYSIRLEGNTADQETAKEMERELIPDCVFKEFY